MDTKENKKIKILALVIFFIGVVSLFWSIPASYNINYMNEAAGTSPQTGDDLYIIFGLMAVAVICAVVFAKKILNKNKLK